jgi:hypothetical protein
MGRWEKPEIISRFTIPSTIQSDIGKLEANEMPPEIDGYEVIHEYEFGAIKNQLQEWYKKGIITN